MTYNTFFRWWKGSRILFIQTFVLVTVGVGFTLLSGFSCGDNTPPEAAAGAPSRSVGLGFGPHPSYDGQVHGDLNNPCEYFKGGVYKIRKIVVEVFKHDANGLPVQIYDPVTFKDGVDFGSGNPNSPIGSGLRFNIPIEGAFKIKVRVWGYDCDDLEPPGQCLDCCDDEAEGPYWEEESPWHNNKEENFPYAYVSYPRFVNCG